MTKQNTQNCWAHYNAQLHFQIADKIYTPVSCSEACEVLSKIFLKQGWMILSLAKLKTAQEKKKTFDFFIGMNFAFDGEAIRYKDLCVFLGNRTSMPYKRKK